MRQSKQKEEGGTMSAMFKKKPPDKLTTTAVVGFQVQDKTGTVQPGTFFIRYCREIYGRPAYQDDAGSDLYLYWIENGGSMQQGWQEEEEVHHHADLFKKMGNWIVATKLGDNVRGPTCLAYVEDLAASPDQIPRDKQWHICVRKGKDGNEGKYERNAEFRLEIIEEDVATAKNILADFDGDFGDDDEIDLDEEEEAAE